ncbi:DUF485 domain-containing protein [Streptomyces calidiresistens]|uniref:DUF485 domain-containing protein n=1 Tax=Streptomyces calidiresistens TaxID=1485586 RepID=A0A7W3T706_9ACTN|nr:DUF485 domain-containing protein [Streptomyces calidiresistens]MBB0232098.1 DUF485 domain-containing protein [Streptomyces calidiresistens]
MTTTHTAPEATDPPPGGDLRSRSITMHEDPRFIDLRRRLVRFVAPMSIAFMAWYLLYVIMSAFARDVLATTVVGNVNIALVFGVLQFVTTFGIAVWYARYAGRRLDPLADELRGELEAGPAGAADGAARTAGAAAPAAASPAGTAERSDDSGEARS